MQTHKIFVLTLSLFGVLNLTGCSLGPVATPTVARYFLQAPANQPVVQHKHKKTSLLLASIASAPGYDSTAMHYVITPYQLQSFATHAWVSPPAQLWQPILMQSLQKSGLLTIVQTPTPIQTHYRLQVTLNHFEQNFQKPQSVFNMGASVQLQNIVSGKVIASKTFNISIPAQTNTPYAGVLAANQAIAIMDENIRNLLENYLFGSKAS